MKNENFTETDHKEYITSKSNAKRCSRRDWHTDMTVTFGLVLFELCLLRLVTAWGEGAIGIRPVDSRHVLFTESNLNEVILYDITAMKIRDRRPVHDLRSIQARSLGKNLRSLPWVSDVPEPGLESMSQTLPIEHFKLRYPQFICFVTCQSCNYGIGTIGWRQNDGRRNELVGKIHSAWGGALFKFHFTEPLSTFTRRTVGSNEVSSDPGPLASSSAEALPFSSSDEDDYGYRDGGMLAISPDGSKVFVQDSGCKCVWWFDPKQAHKGSPKRSSLHKLIEFPDIFPRAVSMYHSNYLFVTLTLTYIVRIDLKKFLSSQSERPGRASNLGHVAHPAESSICFMRIPEDCENDSQGHQRSLLEAVPIPEGEEHTIYLLSHIHGRGGSIQRVRAGCESFHTPFNTFATPGNGAKYQPPTANGTTSRQLLHKKDGARVHRKSNTVCHVMAGDTRAGSGWSDGMHLAARFTRPHSMMPVLRDSSQDTSIRDWTHGKHELIVSDIDNIGLRKVAFDSLTARGFVSTLPYAEAAGLQVIKKKVQVGEKPPLACNSGLLLEQSSKNWECAHLACESQGKRLCSASQLLEAGLEDDTKHVLNATTFKDSAQENRQRFWTSEDCASCWKPIPGVCGCKMAFPNRLKPHLTKANREMDSKRLVLELPGSSNPTCPKHCGSNYECSWNGGHMTASSNDGWKTASFECIDNDVAFSYLCCSHGQWSEDQRDVGLSVSVKSSGSFSHFVILAALILVVVGFIKSNCAIKRPEQSPSLSR